METFKVDLPIWSVLEVVEYPQNPLVLVKMESCTGHKMNVRVDIQKMTVIDNTPITFGKEIIAAILKRVEMIKQNRKQSTP